MDIQTSQRRASDLHERCIQGRDVCLLQILIDKDANISAVTEFGRTPLHLSAFAGHLDIVKVCARNATIETSKHVFPDRFS